MFLASPCFDHDAFGRHYVCKYVCVHVHVHMRACIYIYVCVYVRDALRVFLKWFTGKRATPACKSKPIEYETKKMIDRRRKFIWRQQNKREDSSYLHMTVISKQKV